MKTLAMFLSGMTVLLAASSPAGAQILHRDLTHWGPHPVQLPAVQPLPIIRPVYPWYGTNITVYPRVYPNYYYPPTRWDRPAWDGQTRNVQPPAKPSKTPREPVRPLVMEWNDATGRAEVQHLDRWDSRSAAPAPDNPATKKTPPPTESLNRWDG